MVTWTILIEVNSDTKINEEIKKSDIENKQIDLDLLLAKEKILKLN